MLLLFKCLELIDEQGGHFSGHRFFAGPNGQAEHLHEKNHRRIRLSYYKISSSIVCYGYAYLCLAIRLQSQQTADLLALSMNNASTDHIVRIRIDRVQQLHTEAGQFQACCRQIHRLCGFEHFLCALLLTANVRQSN